MGLELGFLLSGFVGITGQPCHSERRVCSPASSWSQGVQLGDEEFGPRNCASSVKSAIKWEMVCGTTQIYAQT